MKNWISFSEFQTSTLEVVEIIDNHIVYKTNKGYFSFDVEYNDENQVYFEKNKFASCVETYLNSWHLSQSVFASLVRLGLTDKTNYDEVMKENYQRQKEYRLLILKRHILYLGQEGVDFVNSIDLSKKE